MSKFAETSPEAGTGRVEIIESLGWLEWRVGKGDEAPHLVQIVNKPH
jgi:hypothetical protein